MNEINTNQLSLFDENLKSVMEISSKYESLTQDIKDAVRSIFYNFLDIARKLSEVKTNELFKVADYQNIYDYAKNEFDLGRTTTKNLISIYDKFCDQSKSWKVTLKDEYKDFSYSQLVELLSIDNLELGSYVPSMSIREIRENKLKTKLYSLFDEAIDLETESSLINRVKSYITENYLSKHKLSIKVSNLDENSYEKRIYLTYSLDKRQFFEIQFSLRKSLHTIRFCIYFNRYDLIRSFSKDFTTLEELQGFLDEYFAAYEKSILPKDEQDAVSSSADVQAEKNDIVEAGVLDDDTEEFFAYYDFNGDDEIFFLLQSIDEKLPGIFSSFQFSSLNYEELNLHISDDEIIRFSNNNELKVEYFKKKQLWEVKTFTFADLLFPVLRNILCGQTSDQITFDENDGDVNE